MKLILKNNFDVLSILQRLNRSFLYLKILFLYKTKLVKTKF